MRLYLKLFAMTIAASAIQLAIGGPGQWLDETQFAIRVYVADQLGIPPQSPILVDAADSLRVRTAARLGVILPLPSHIPVTSSIAKLAADDVCDETGNTHRLYARAG